MTDRISTTHCVTVAFDAEADVWHTADSTLFGLNAEADTLDDLLGKIGLYAESLLGSRVQVEKTDGVAGGHGVILHSRMNAGEDNRGLSA